MNWENDYDNWKLASPYDDEPEIEVFKAENYEYYTTCYDTVIKFDLEMIKAEKSANILEVDLEEVADELAEMLRLSTSEESAMERN